MRGARHLRRLTIRTLLLALFLGASALLAACGAASTDANVQLLLTDAPADEASELKVTFGDVYLVAGDEGGLLKVSDAGGSFDVLELRNGQTVLMGETAVPDGTYSQLRVIVESAEIVIDGEMSDVKIPSGAQSGLKINIDPPLVAASGQTSVITLDFNARRVIQTGNGQYMMSPTALRAVSISGSLQGVLVDAEGAPLAGGVVSVSDGDTSVTEAISAADGRFKIITLTEGSYTVTVALEGYETQTFEVTVTPNDISLLTEDGTITLLSVN